MDSRANHVKNVGRINAKKREAEKSYEESSKERLNKIVSQKIKTTMIGSVAQMEEVFGHLWGHKEGGPHTTEQEEIHNMFLEFRSNVMRIGNDQIRTLKDEFSRYTVVWDKYQLNLRVIKNEKEGQENE